MHTPPILREPNGANAAAAANRPAGASPADASEPNVRLATGLRAGTQNPPRMPYGTGIGPK